MAAILFYLPQCQSLQDGSYFILSSTDDEGEAKFRPKEKYEVKQKLKPYRYEVPVDCKGTS